MKKMPFLFELALMLVFVLMLPIAIVTYFSSTSMITYSQQEIAASAIAKLESNSELIENMLNGIVHDVIKLMKVNKLGTLRDANSYEVLNQNYDNVSKVFDILDGLNEIVNSTDIVESAYFYLDNADYVVSTKKGVVKTENFESLKWLEEAKSSISGASGIWYPRVSNDASITQLLKDENAGEDINVITYVFRLSKLSTSARGTIVVNVSEKAISKYLNSTHLPSDIEGCLISKSACIISTPNENEFLKELKPSDALYKSIIMSDEKSGYEIVSTDCGKELIAYYKTAFSDWIYVSKYPMKNLMKNVNALRSRYIILSVVIVILGSVLAMYMAGKLSKPMRKLVSDLKESTGGDKDAPVNEMAYIAQTFNKIQNQTDDLHKLLKDREAETKNQALTNLLFGENNTEAEIEEIEKLFKYNHYMVALVSVDNSKHYLDETSHDLRSYHRYVLSEKAQEIFKDGYIAGCARYSRGMLAIIINIKEYDQTKVPRNVGNTLSILRNEALKVMGYTTTIGVSAVHNGLNGIRECVPEAEEALKRRLIEGRNSIIFWHAVNRENYKYYYSYDSEKKILNYLSTYDFESIKKEMNNIIEQIRAINDISPDNILFIFNQLAGSTIKYISEHNKNTKLFPNNENIYSAIATLDTIEEIADYMNEFYKRVLNKPEEVKVTGELKYWDRIENYINEHFREEIVFEDLAKEMGISYSYMRKLTKEKTGKSVIDNVNLKRIDEVKGLLLHTDYNMTQIATEVGYNNVQSMNRFFKKYEGISPGEYKNRQN